MAPRDEFRDDLREIADTLNEGNRELGIIGTRLEAVEALSAANREEIHRDGGVRDRLKAIEGRERAAAEAVDEYHAKVHSAPPIPELSAAHPIIPADHAGMVKWGNRHAPSSTVIVIAVIAALTVIAIVIILQRWIGPAAGERIAHPVEETDKREHERRGESETDHP